MIPEDVDMVEPGNRDITAIIRGKLIDGHLPTERPSQMWARNGRDNECAACDKPIPPFQIEYEISFVRAPRMLRFHRKCFDVWQQERAVGMA